MCCSSSRWRGPGDVTSTSKRDRVAHLSTPLRGRSRADRPFPVLWPGIRVADPSVPPIGRNALATRPSAAGGDDVYELPPVESVDDIPEVWQSPATYTLEMTVRCPH